MNQNEETKESITVNEVIEILNSALKLDKMAIMALVVNRVPCNESLANHESIIVHSQHGGYYVGLMGIINGLFGFDGTSGKIALKFNDDHEVVEFTRFIKDERSNNHQ